MSYILFELFILNQTKIIHFFYKLNCCKKSRRLICMIGQFEINRERNPALSAASSFILCQTILLNGGLRCSDKKLINAPRLASSEAPIISRPQSCPIPSEEWIRRASKRRPIPRMAMWSNGGFTSTFLWPLAIKMHSECLQLTRRIKQRTSSLTYPASLILQLIQVWK